jgi:hypothetical protein
MESRFHRVTPYAAERLRMFLFWTFRETKFWSEVKQTTKWYHIASGREARPARFWQTKIIEKEFPFS